ncbi:M20/M25/M40 family metallo-hydrolase [Bacteroidota bacterium]|nr:M20/M25/M40 family metallo-hydrolase [Bacteroidota bacterium]
MLLNKKKIYTIFFLIFSKILVAQSVVENNIQVLFQKSLTEGKSYEWLDHLSNKIGGRLSGSLNLQRAIEWSKSELENLGLDKVYLQPVMVPKWIRGTFEYANIESSPGNTINVPVCALGGSISTPLGGLRAKVIEVKSFDELSKRKNEVNGKIVFFNRPMRSDFVNTFDAYSDAVDQRTQGAEIASKLGAVGVIVRSLNLKLDDQPHTGTMSYGNLPLTKRIPAASISTNGAELLSSMLSLNKNLKFYLKQNCKNLPDVKSFNVIGEIKGSKYPDEIMVVGAHLDSWDLGDGAHDDGAGVVQSMEVARLLKKINYKPKRTLRIVLFINEENGQRGAAKYNEESKIKKENHVFAIESDTGGFSPSGFSIDSNEEKFKIIEKWSIYFKPYLIHHFEKGRSGADISFLKNKNNVLVGFRTDSQRYFEYHHSENDVFSSINKRELELGAASIASLVYLVDYFKL